MWPSNVKNKNKPKTKQNKNNTYLPNPHAQACTHARQTLFYIVEYTVYL